MNQGWIPIPEGVGTSDVDIGALLKVLPIVILSPFGPTIAALSLTYHSKGREGLKKIWKNLTYWQISPKWFAAILLLRARAR
jgi:hypothetical protein